MLPEGALTLSRPRRRRVVMAQDSLAARVRRGTPTLGCRGQCDPLRGSQGLGLLRVAMLRESPMTRIPPDVELPAQKVM